MKCYPYRTLSERSEYAAVSAAEQNDLRIIGLHVRALAGARLSAKDLRWWYGARCRSDSAISRPFFVPFTISEKMQPKVGELISRQGWYEEGKVRQALTGDMVRSKSELVIANLLHERGVPFRYEMLLLASDGTMYLPDFTITWNGETWYWERWGMTSSDAYQRHRQAKTTWYSKHFPGRLLETFEGATLSQDAADLIQQNFSY
jgi:hypothetical protein